jgi:RHS repeat-associated protein
MLRSVMPSAQPFLSYPPALFFTSRPIHHEGIEALPLLHNRLYAAYHGSVRVTEYTYDATGMMALRTDKTNKTTRYMYSPGGELLYKEKAQEGYARSIVYNQDGIAGWTDSKTEGLTTTKTNYYVLTDHLGSATMVTDEAGNPLWQSEYKPFGDIANAQGSLDMDGIFTGKEYDPDTGLYYFNARWYDPATALFLTEDPIMNGATWYAYCGNNPLNFTDPRGLWVIFVVGAAVGFVASSASEIGIRMASGKSFGEAVKATYTSGKSWAIIGSATVIGCITSGVAAAAVSAVTSGATSVGVAAAETIVINAAGGAVASAGNQMAKKAINGEKQDLAETGKATLEGAVYSAVLSGITQAAVGTNSCTTSTTLKNAFGEVPKPYIQTPRWDDAFGTITESVVPTAVEVYKNLSVEESEE